MLFVYCTEIFSENWMEFLQYSLLKSKLNQKICTEERTNEFHIWMPMRLSQLFSSVCLMHIQQYLLQLFTMRCVHKLIGRERSCLYIYIYICARAVHSPFVAAADHRHAKIPMLNGNSQWHLYVYVVVVAFYNSIKSIRKLRCKTCNVGKAFLRLWMLSDMARCHHSFIITRSISINYSWR